MLRGDASEVEEAAQQFEFLNEIHGGGGGASVEAMSLCYIGALIASRKDRDPTAAVGGIPLKKKSKKGLGFRV